MLGVELMIGIPDHWADKARKVLSLPVRSARLDHRNHPPIQDLLHGGEDQAAEDARKRIAGVKWWYHTIDLGHGIVTPGGYDHRPHVGKYGIPKRLDGKRVLDVATFDGFWAFEMERRGAKEVVAIDLDRFGSLDLPPRIRATMPQDELERPIGQGFRLCHELLNSKVHRQEISVYDLGPDCVGKFDFVFQSDLLLHLMNPMKALQNVRSVTGDTALIVEIFDPNLPGKMVEFYGGGTDYTWWKMSFDALRQMVIDAGFKSVDHASTFKIGHRGEDSWIWHAAFVCKN